MLLTAALTSPTWITWPFTEALLTGGLVLLAIFVLTWVIAQRINNYGVVDVVWGFGLVGMALWLGLAGWQDPSVVQWRLVFFLGLVVLEYTRLGSYIARRFYHDFPREDARYATCRAVWAAKAPLLMLLAYALQSLLIAAMMLPVAWVAYQPVSGMLPLEIVGIVIWVVGFIIELVADKTLKSFKALAKSHGQVCTIGVWRLSRHPNYFGQWLQWLGFALAAAAHSGGWIMLYIPILMYLFLTRITGISITETYMQQKYGTAFDTYAKATPSFFPSIKILFIKD